jgi:integrase
MAPGCRCGNRQLGNRPKRFQSTCVNSYFPLALAQSPPHLSAETLASLGKMSVWTSFGFGGPVAISHTHGVSAVRVRPSTGCHKSTKRLAVLRGPELTSPRMDAESPSAAADLLVSDYFDQWLAHVRTRVRIKTWEGYETLLRLHATPRIGALPLAEVTPLHLQRVYAELMAGERPLSGGSVLNLHLVLTQAFGQAVRWGMIARSPTAGAQPPRPRRSEPVVVDQALAHRLLEVVARTPYALAAAIALGTGMRRGKILALRWSDLEADLSVAYVRRSVHPTRDGLAYELPKTRRSRRTVVMPEYLRVMLRAQRDDQTRRREDQGSVVHHDLVVVDPDGLPMHPDSLSGGWRRALRHEGLPPVRFHDLRHAHATLMLQQGIHPKIVSERLGHSSIGITLDTYSHVLPSMQEEAAKAADEIFGAA